jgi:hypothetical protein
MDEKIESLMESGMTPKEKKPEKPLWEWLYRQILLRCNSPTNKLYPEIGAKGIKCLFNNPEEIKKLYDRDNAQAMKEPTLVRKNSKRHFSRWNCYFAEYIDYLYKSMEEDEEKFEKECQRKQEMKEKRMAESRKRHELMWARQKALKEARKKEKENQMKASGPMEESGPTNF